MSAFEWTRGKRLAGRLFLFPWFLFGGFAHFVATDTGVRLEPPEIPFPYAAVRVSGGWELLGAGGLLFATTRRAAGMRLFALTILVKRFTLIGCRSPSCSRHPTGCWFCDLPSKWRCGC